MRRLIWKTTRFVIGDADGAVHRVAFHQVDFAFHQVPIEDWRLVEFQLEMLWNPHWGVHRYVLQPTTQVGAELLHFALPHAVDGRREILGIRRRHAVKSLIQRLQGRGQSFLRDGKQLLLL